MMIIMMFRKWILKYIALYLKIKLKLERQTNFHWQHQKTSLDMLLYSCVGTLTYTTPDTSVVLVKISDLWFSKVLILNMVAAFVCGVSNNSCRLSSRFFLTLWSTWYQWMMYDTRRMTARGPRIIANNVLTFQLSGLVTCLLEPMTTGCCAITGLISSPVRLCPVVALSCVLWSISLTCS